MELGSVDQAKDLVKFHVNYPPTVNGEQIQFSISNTFSFLQVQVNQFSTSHSRNTTSSIVVVVPTIIRSHGNR